MSVVLQKKPDGSQKAWAVSVRRNNKIYRKYFKLDELEKAKEYNDHLLATLPPIDRSTGHLGNNSHKRRPKASIKVSRCTLHYSKNAEDRCECSCNFYNDCLTEAAKRNWPGFTATKGGK